MRLNTLKPLFLSMPHSDQLALIEAIQDDRLKRGHKKEIRGARKLAQELNGLSKEDKAHILSELENG